MWIDRNEAEGLAALLTGAPILPGLPTAPGGPCRVRQGVVRMERQGQPFHPIPSLQPQPHAGRSVDNI